MEFKTPDYIKKTAEVIGKAGYKAYLVGGCVRDVLLARTPKDWDIATDAAPEEIQKIFSDTVYENEFGTVGVKIELENGEKTVVEATTFRKEGRYTDKRHPDYVKFSKTIEDDLSRRDFTINALALDLGVTRSQSANSPAKNNDERFALSNLRIVDPYGGQDDLKKKIIKAVGDSNDRFEEDALRLMRAVRFAAELGFAIESKTSEAVLRHAGLLEMIAKERIRDEFTKIIMSDLAAQGIQMLENFGLLKHIMPELREGINVGQNKHHIYTVWEHNLRALQYSADKKYSLEVRMASLLHDVGKPRSKQGDGPNSTFHGHDVIGAKMTVKILDRLHYSKEFIEQVSHLVRYHLFYYNVGEVTAAGVRRFIRRVGPENIDDLIKVREADRIGSGVPKAVPYKLRHLLFMIEKVKRDPVSPKMLAVDGKIVMEAGGLEPSPKVGHILAVLLEEVLDDPKKNSKEYLVPRIKELSKMPDSELDKIANKSRERKEEFEGEVEAEMKKQYYVK